MTRTVTIARANMVRGGRPACTNSASEAKSGSADLKRLFSAFTIPCLLGSACRCWITVPRQVGVDVSQAVSIVAVTLLHPGLVPGASRPIEHVSCDGEDDGGEKRVERTFVSA